MLSQGHVINIGGGAARSPDADFATGAAGDDEQEDQPGHAQGWWAGLAAPDEADRATDRGTGRPPCAAREHCDECECPRGAAVGAPFGILIRGHTRPFTDPPREDDEEDTCECLPS
jgi:hypothetical protein